MLDYNTNMIKMSYDSVLYVLENIPQAKDETRYIAVTKHNQYIVCMTGKNKNGFVKHYITCEGENFDCSTALNAALSRKPSQQAL